MEIVTMDKTVRMNLNVDPDVPSKLAELAGGQRRMGIYLSHLIQTAYNGQQVAEQQGEFEMVQNAVKHLSAKVKELDARLSQVEH